MSGESSGVWEEAAAMSVLVKLHSSELIQRTAEWELRTCGGHELRRGQ
jgi:hypothetical protein